MDKKVKVGILVVAVLALAAIVFSVGQTATGNATFTPGASYGPVYDTAPNYVDCVYVTADDGWDVTQVATVRYKDKTNGQIDESSDSCQGPRTVREYDCNKAGYRETRLVTCPSGKECNVGKCVPA